MEVMPWRKAQVLAVEIYPSPSQPHYLNRLGPAEGVFTRYVDGATKLKKRFSVVGRAIRAHQEADYLRRACCSCWAGRLRVKCLTSGQADHPLGGC